MDLWINIRFLLTLLTCFYALRIYLSTRSRPAMWLLVYNLNMLFMRLFLLTWIPPVLSYRSNLNDLLMTLNVVVMFEVLYLIESQIKTLKHR